MKSALHEWLGTVACEGFLVGRTCACDLVGGAGSCLSEGQCHESSVFWDVCGLGMVFGSLSASGKSCISVLLMLWHEMLGTGFFWLSSGAWS